MNPSKNDAKTTGRFHAKTTMLEALSADPTLGMVLMRDFHLGGCSHCGFDPQDIHTGGFHPFAAIASMASRASAKVRSSRSP